MWARSSEGNERGLSGTEVALAAMRARATPVGGFRATLLPARAATQLAEAYRLAEGRALAPDPCLHPEFLAAAARHDPALRDLAILALWKGEDLCALAPILPGGWVFSRRVLRVPRIDMASAGAPFVVREQAEDVVAAALAWFADRGAEPAFEDLDADSPFRGVLERVCARRAAAARLIAAAPARPVAATPAGAGANPTGAVFERAGEPAALRAAVENYLLLEAREAARAGRTALIQQAGAANFVRAVTRQLGRAERCRVFCLRDAAGALAVGIVLTDAQRPVLWRVSCDPERGGEAAKALLANRIARAFERGRGGALVGIGPDASGRVSLRVEGRASHGPAGLARRLGERLRRAAFGELRAA
ncbi:MAG: GNAT family N-acetyltransferase [Salinarimonadaceae bacterium]|nr:MAG: GNAT family N-acetyltransferase [Salinarimonadaceae bacterium]